MSNSGARSRFAASFDLIAASRSGSRASAVAMASYSVSDPATSSGKPISVRKLVEGWINENHWNINLNLGHYPYPDYEPLAFWGDRGKLDSFLASM